MDIYDFIFPCSTLYKFGSRRSLKMVFDQISKHLDIRQKIILRVLFSTLFSLLGNVVKHDLSCLNDTLLATKQVPNNERILPASQYQLCLKKKYTATPKEQQLKDITLTFLVNSLYSCRQKRNVHVTVT